MTIGKRIRTEARQVRPKGQKKFTQLKEKLPKRNVWTGVRLTKVQTTTRTDHVWPEVWTNTGKTNQIRENRYVQKKNQTSTMLED